MYKEIEELEKKLKQGRAPAQVIDESKRPIDVVADMPQHQQESSPLTYAPTKKIFKDAAHTPFAGPEVKRVLPGGAGAGGESVVGGRAPDYSGYDDLITKFKNKGGRDTSTADLLIMAGTTGLGALFGNVGVAAKSAGEYGMDRYNKAEKRADAHDDLMTKLELAKAQAMAKGAKGTKVKNGGGVDAYGKAYLNRYRDNQGNLRTPQYQNEVGQWIADESDPLYQSPEVSVFEQNTPDGLKNQFAKRGNNVVAIGQSLPDLSLQKDAKGQLAGVNKKTLQAQSLPDAFNKTSTGLSPYASQQYATQTGKVESDTILKGIEGSYNDMVQGMTALGKGDVGNAKIAVKMLASALEKGRMTSDADVRQVSEMNIGLVPWFENKLSKAKTGQEIDAVRKEIESAYSTIQTTLRAAYDRRLNTYNHSVKRLVGSEYHDGLAFKGLPEFGRKTQTQFIEKSLKKDREMVSSGEWVEPVIGPNGEQLKGRFIMLNGKKTQIGFEQ